MKSYAKINIFLKIVALRGEYHELNSRFVLVDSLYDEFSLVEKRSEDKFELVGNFDCKVEDNIITKAYNELISLGFDLRALFDKYALHVQKNIPTGAGLGGGSSNAATFLRLCNEKLELKLSVLELAKIGERLGADVAFFIYQAKSANVSGIGENIAPFNDILPPIEIATPDVFCSTKEVYATYREHFTQTMDERLAYELKNQSTQNILINYEAKELNDLLNPALVLHEELQSYVDDGWFMSGSGSSMFRIKNG